MPGQINISNEKGRDAVVATSSVRKTVKVRWIDEKSRQASSCSVVKSTIACDINALVKQAGAIEDVADKLIQSDADVDMEVAGQFIKGASRIYINPDGEVVHKVKQFEILKNPDGSVRERRPRKANQPNTAVETPLKWTGKLMKKTDVYRRFVFAGKQQLVHVNGLTYDFLYEMAKNLEEKESLMLIGAGPKGTQPLIFSRGGTQYRGFLEGRTDGDRYCLLLHLSNMELKAPPKSEIEEKVETEKADGATDEATETEPKEDTHKKAPARKAKSKAKKSDEDTVGETPAKTTAKPKTKAKPAKKSAKPKKGDE